MSHDLIRKEEKLILEAADKQGLTLKRIRTADIEIDPRRKEREIDGLLDRCMGHFRSIYVNEYYETTGVRCLNNSSTLRICGDKARTSMVLASRGIPQPRSILALGTDKALEIMESIGYPLVMKPVIGSWGRLISRINDRDSAESLLEHKTRLGGFQHSVFYLQEYIDKGDSDIRAFVVGDETICAIYRESSHWITNTARGATVTNCPVNEDMNDLCQGVREAVDGDLIAVDLFEKDGEYMVNEVNHTMEFKNSISPTGVDIPSRIVSHFRDCVKR